MKRLTLIFATLLTVACGGAKKKQIIIQGQQETLQTIEHSSSELDLDIGIDDEVRINELEDVEQRERRANLSSKGMIFDVTVTDADGFEGYSDIRIKITKSGIEVFDDYAGRVHCDFECDVDKFFPREENDAITAPDDVLFFADIDFDGADELITGRSPFAGSQRNLPGFGSIYRLNDGKYTDATDEFTSRCEVFNEIEPYCFIVDYRNKSIIHFNDGGYMSGGWEVYHYADGKYRYDRYVHFDREVEGESVVITIDYIDNAPRKSLRVSTEDFEKRGYDF
ncbi:MAG: hypothetical protein J6U73_04015 [Alistipes sp.]|nr:hypothetical protein [Alistipes sp.]